jgi:hypothetical protein
MPTPREGGRTPAYRRARIPALRVARVKRRFGRGNAFSFEPVQDSGTGTRVSAFVACNALAQTQEVPDADIAGDRMRTDVSLR